MDITKINHMDWVDIMKINRENQMIVDNIMIKDQILEDLNHHIKDGGAKG